MDEETKCPDCGAPDWVSCDEQCSFEIERAKKAEQAAVVCDEKGHEFEIFASIGPDSGTEHLLCMRCGHSDKIIWY
jgi:hypothetical protein